ncbi:hypothetical protein NL676_035128 [Syzygium grande]|nr:hypothetical protein NL676_035128 [Syzygium grande]
MAPTARLGLELLDLLARGAPKVGQTPPPFVVKSMLYSGYLPRQGLERRRQPPRAGVGLICRIQPDTINFLPSRPTPEMQYPLDDMGTSAINLI